VPRPGQAVGNARITYPATSSGLGGMSSSGGPSWWGQCRLRVDPPGGLLTFDCMLHAEEGSGVWHLRGEMAAPRTVSPLGEHARRELRACGRRRRRPRRGPGSEHHEGPRRKVLAEDCGRVVVALPVVVVGVSRRQPRIGRPVATGAGWRRVLSQFVLCGRPGSVPAPARPTANGPGSPARMASQSTWSASPSPSRRNKGICRVSSSPMSWGSSTSIR
jgi:hypothetical protein